MKKLRLIFLAFSLMVSGGMVCSAQQTADDRIAALDGEFFSIDRSHSTLKFIVGFMGLTDTEGTFDSYRATILYNEDDMTKTEVILRIDAKSVDTGSDFRDRDLNSERFFHTEKYPEITFRSISIKPADSGYTLNGNLTIKGITKRISIPIKHILKRTEDIGWGNIRIGFSGETTLMRNDFNIHGGDFWGLKALSEEVRIEFTLLGTNRNLERIGYNSQNKRSIGEILEEEFINNGAESAVLKYQKLKDEQAGDVNFSERELNLFVNRLYQRDKLIAASTLVDLYVREFPESSIAWTTMGEIYAKSGQIKESINAFQKAYDLDSGNDLAFLALKRLNAKS